MLTFDVARSVCFRLVRLILNIHVCKVGSGDWKVESGKWKVESA